MKEENLIINKDNYKEYVELYRVKTTMSDEEYKNNIDTLKKVVLIFLGGITTAIITTPFYGLGLVAKNVVVLELITAALIEFGITINYVVKVNNLKKKKVNDIKEKYPYIDTDIDINELEANLEVAKILKYDEKCSNTILDVNGYKNYLQVEEEKEKYFKETKYDKYIVNSEIDNIELEKTKVKKLVR